MHSRPERLAGDVPRGGGAPRRRTRATGGAARRALGGAVALAAVLLVGPADPAGAHDPIFIDDATAAEDSPRILDGSISFATYGLIGTPGGSGHLRLDLEAGDELVVELLVPDQPPENTLADFSHLRVTVDDPAGEATVLDAGQVLGRFDEPFTGTSYLRLLEATSPALPGTYTITVTSEVPTRFTLATGRTEQFGTPVEAYERLPLTELDTWYATAPPTTAAPPDDGGAGTGGEADATAGTDGGSADDTAGGADEQAEAVPDGEAVADLDEDSGAPAAAVALGAVAVVLVVTGGVLAVRRRNGGADDGADGGPGGGTDVGPGGGPDGGTDGREPPGAPHAAG